MYGAVDNYVMPEQKVKILFAFSSQEAEVALDGLQGLASFIRSGVAKYQRINAEVAAVEDRLMAKISAAEAAA